MTDRDKVIKGLECCMSEQICKGCPYKDKDECEGGGYYYSKAIEDALAMLEEQEPVSPDINPDGTIICGNCGENIGYISAGSKTPKKLRNFCPECGKAVKWDD